MPSPFVTMKWGSAGHLTRALFDQGEIWVTAKSEVLRIADMHPTHILNTLLMVERLDDLPVENLHGTKLYEALYDRVLGYLPKRAEAGPVWPYARRVATEYSGIMSILEAAVAANLREPSPLTRARVLIDYTDVVGNVSKEREIIPSRVEWRRIGAGFKEPYLHAWDVEKSATRLFKIEGIARCQDA